MPCTGVSRGPTTCIPRNFIRCMTSGYRSCGLQQERSRATGKASQQATFLRQAMADADWDTVERHGCFNAVVEKIIQREQENPASNGRGLIDDFRLWGSRWWSRTNAPPQKPRWRTWVARAFNHPNAFISEGGPLAVVVESFPVASRAIEASVKGKGEGSGGGDGGARGEPSPVGVRRGRSPSPAPMYYIG